MQGDTKYEVHGVRGKSTSHENDPHKADIRSFCHIQDGEKSYICKLCYKSSFQENRIYGRTVIGDEQFSGFSGIILHDAWRQALRFPCEQRIILQLCVRSKRVQQLLSTAPALLWCTLPYVCGLDTEELEQFFGQKRSAIVQQCLLLDTPQYAKNALKLLEKLSPPLLPQGKRSLLRKVAMDAYIMHILRHNPDPTWETLYYAIKATFWDYYNYKAVAKCLQKPAQQELQQYEKILDAVRELDSRWWDIALSGEDTSYRHLDALFDSFTRCASVHTMERMCDRAEMQLNKIIRSRNNIEISPPFEGTATIIPLTSGQALEEEGADMQHCVGGYAEKMFEGRCYVYKVLAPQRATLSLYRQDGAWQLGELRGVHNADVDEQTHQYVQQWFTATLKTQYRSL